MLCSRYQSRLLAFCRHMLGSREDAEDVLQEVFAAAFNAVLADEREINVRPWLYRIARNRSLNHLRRVSPVGVDTMDIHFADSGLTTTDKVMRRENFRELIADVQDLPETQRTALLLREIDALSYDQIASAMETTVPSVKSLLVRARISLAEAAEARKLSCEEVRLELGEVSEGILKLSTPARRHVRGCERCRSFRKHLRDNNRALAAIMPVAPLFLLKRLVLAKLGSTASAGGAHVAGGAGATVGAGAGATATAGAAASGSVGLAGGVMTAGAGAIATKAVAGLAAAAIVTAGAVAAGSRGGAPPWARADIGARLRERAGRPVRGRSTGRSAGGPAGERRRQAARAPRGRQRGAAREDGPPNPHDDSYGPGDHGRRGLEDRRDDHQHPAAGGCNRRRHHRIDGSRRSSRRGAACAHVTRTGHRGDERNHAAAQQRHRPSCNRDDGSGQPAGVGTDRCSRWRAGSRWRTAAGHGRRTGLPPKAPCSPHPTAPPARAERPAGPAAALKRYRTLLQTPR